MIAFYAGWAYRGYQGDGQSEGAVIDPPAEATVSHGAAAWQETPAHCWQRRPTAAGEA